MSSTYKILTGDTFESIARKEYGSEEEASRIASANPGVVEPFTAGVSISIPALPDAPQNVQQQAVSDSEDEVALLIEGERFRFWNTMRITRAIDSMDTIEFGAPFDSNAPGFKETFRPFSYKEVVVTVGGEPLFTGTMVGINPVLETNQKVISVNGYSLPGVLNDCTMPASSYPIEYNNQGLRDIANAITKPFGLSVSFEVDQGAVFERVAADTDKKALTFLAELAKQRNLVISSTSRGALLFQQSIETGNPVARLQQGVSPVLSVTPMFNPQDYYSHVTGIEPMLVGLKGSQFTVKNPHLEGVVRPLTFDAPDTLDADVQKTVNAKIGRMFGNMASYAVRVPTWRDSFGNLWEPNTLVTLVAPDAMVYNEYEFVIRSVEFEKDAKVKIATLILSIPGSFSGKIPESMPWDL